MYAVYQNSYSGNINQLSPEFTAKEEAERYLLKYGSPFSRLEVKEVESQQIRTQPSPVISDIAKKQIRSKKDKFRRSDVR